MYIVTACASTMYLIYALLLLFGVLTPKDYREAVGWVAATLFLCLLWPSVLHKTENHVIVKKESDD